MTEETRRPAAKKTAILATRALSAESIPRSGN
jgi:hypothetical protein